MQFVVYPGVDENLDFPNAVRDRLAKSPELTDAMVKATAAPPGSARMNAAILPNGTPTVMNETGQPMTSFGNTPMSINGGSISFAPVPDSPAANVAGYWQTKTKSGGKVKGIWAIVQAPINANTSLALVLPTLPWANGSLTSAQVHHVESPSGSWHTSIWTGSSENPKYLPDSFAGAWNDDKPRLIGVFVNEQDNSVTVRHADGSISQSAPGVIDSTLLSEYGIIESYRFVNTTADPAVKIKILRWGLIDQADVSNLVSLGIPSYRDIGKAITAALPKNPAAMQYRATTDTVYTATTTLADVDATNVKLTFTVPTSGQVLLRVSAFVNITGSAHYLWNLNATWPGGSSGYGAQRVSIGATSEVKSKEWLISGLTPGATITTTLQHMSTVAASGGITCGNPSGYSLQIVALPVN